MIKNIKLSGLLCGLFITNVQATDTTTLDMNKVNSSSVRPTISFDALDQSLSNVERQLAQTSAQVQELKKHVDDIKKSAQNLLPELSKKEETQEVQSNQIEEPEASESSDDEQEFEDED